MNSGGWRLRPRPINGGDHICLRELALGEFGAYFFTGTQSGWRIRLAKHHIECVPEGTSYSCNGLYCDVLLTGENIRQTLMAPAKFACQVFTRHTRVVKKQGQISSHINGLDLCIKPFVGCNQVTEKRFGCHLHSLFQMPKGNLPASTPMACNSRRKCVMANGTTWATSTYWYRSVSNRAAISDSCTPTGYSNLPS